MINDYLVYVLLAFTIVAIPGPAVVLTIRNSLKYGPKVAIVNICGNFVAMVLLAVISAVGLGAVILASSSLFQALKVLGCLYLVYLGIKAWRAEASTDFNGNNGICERSLLSVFREGFGVGVANPKAIAFFTALFPQFVDPTRAFVPQFVTLILTIEGISFLVLGGYALCASLVAAWLSTHKVMGVFNKLAGTAFIGFGAALLWDD